MAELAPNLTYKEADFSILSRRLSDIEQELRTVNAPSQDSRMSLQTIDKRKQEPEWFTQFANVSFRLNETFYNLTHAQESLRNSTTRTANLVEEYKKSEKNYMEKGMELEEYTGKVEDGIIPKVNFTFVH